MPITTKDWKQLPADLAPTAGETVADWRARIAAYAAANPTLVTPINAAALEDLETRLGAYADSQVAGHTHTALTVQAAGTPSVRALGTGATDAAAGNDARLSDQRTPTDGSVTPAKVNTALKPSGSAATSDEALRALGTSAGQALPGNHASVTNARAPTAHTHPPADIGTGTPAAGKYVDGGTGAWTSLPAQSGHVVEDEGTPLTARTKLNFTGAGVTATDNPGADSTDISISGAGVSDASTTVKGVTKLATAPGSASAPIAVGDNDPRVTADQAAGTASIRTLGTGAAQAAAGNHTHTKADVGLANVDNTSDANKPVSTAQAAADALALAKASNLSDVANAATARTNLGLGTAATQASTAFVASTALDTDGTLAANSDAKVASQKAVKTYVDAHAGGGGSVAIETLWLPRSPLSPGLRPGRTWRADFADQDATNAMFDFAASAGSWTYSTDAADSNRAVVVPPSPYPAIGKITAKFGMLRNFEVAIRFKTPVAVHSSTIVRAIGRYLSDDNLFALSKSFSTNSLDLIRRDKDTGSAHQGTINNVAHTLDTTAAHIYKLKLRGVDNVFWGKCWLDGTAEPDWQVVGRPGSSGGIRRDMGLAGIWFQDVNGGANVSELVVTELVPAGEDIILNGDFQIMGAGNGAIDGWTSGVIGWPLPAISSPGNSLCEWVTVAGPDGASRRFLHMRRPTMGDGLLPQITQDIYRRDEMVGDQLGGDNMDWLDANYIEVGVTSKVTNARHGAVASFLGFTAEAYWFDETTTVTNISTGSGGYFKALGPNRANAAGDLRGDGQDGMGTWGWRRDLVRIDVSAAKTARPNRLTLSIGPHDNDTLVDDALLGDLSVRPVA